MRRWGVALVAGAIVGVACVGADPASVSPSPDGGTSSGGTSGASGGTSGSTSSGGTSSGEPLVDIDAGTLACDPAEVIPEDAIHVATDGDDNGDGSALAPFKTLSTALAKVTGPKLVVLAEGTYTSSKIVLTKAHAGVTLRGGHTRSGAAWSKNCAVGAPQRTLLSSTDAVGVDIAFDAEATPVTLETMTVATKVEGASAVASKSAESTYGVFVHGAGTKVSLRGVNVRAGRGGAGTVPTAPSASTTVRTCDQLSACASGNNGTTPTTAPPNAATGGHYDVNGFVLSNGGAGPVGGDGANGVAGKADVGVGQCSACGGDPCGYLGPDTQVHYGGKGKCGCAGAGGAGGSGGPGGAASIGVFASGLGVEVKVEAVAIVTTGGGKGALGGPGGNGATGSAGSGGAPTQCAMTCLTSGTGACVKDYKGSPGGVAGGKGGNGAKGAPGGSGAGGDSYGFVTFGTAAIDAAPGAAAFKVGPAGDPGAGAKPGATGESFAAN